MIRKFLTLMCAMATLCGAYGQQVVPRIAGLEGNEEYMSLLREDSHLKAREDSVARVVSELRGRLREDPSSRQLYGQQILSLEEQVFNIRNAKGRLVDRIGAIEQEWVLSNLNKHSEASVQPALAVANDVPESQKRRNLVDNVYFRDQLTTTNYAALRMAQRREREAVDYVNRYFANYHDLVRLAEKYDVVQFESEAADIYGKFRTLQGLNGVLADSLASTWNYIFDNKSYAYAYLLDKLDQDKLLAQQEQLFAEAAQRLTSMRGRYESDVVVDYFVRKQVVANYEEQMAGLLHLDAARDSLRGVMTQLKTIEYQLPKVHIMERSFIEYAPIAFSSAQKYTYANPIPECKIHPRGVVYRILLGTYATKRAASVFKGAYPLCYVIDENNKWNYYVGAYATEQEAQQAQKMVKSKGFVRPEVVVWRDGVYRNITKNPEPAGVSYRIEIVGATLLPDVVRDVIVAQAAGCELSRVGVDLFTVGLFTDKVEADRVAASMRKADGALEIKVSEFTGNTN